MLSRQCFAYALLVPCLVLSGVLEAHALYVPDRHRASYEVPDLLKLPERIAVDMEFRALDPEAEREVYPLIAPDFRERSTSAPKPDTVPPDAFTRSLGLAGGKALYWRCPFGIKNPSVAVEYVGERAVALYVDLDGDGKLGGNEKILPADTAAHFAVPAFRRKREGWSDHELRFFLDAERKGSGAQTPALSWYHLLQLGNEHSRRMSMWTPDGTRNEQPDDPFCRAVEVGKRCTPLYSKVRVKDQDQWSVVATEDGLATTLFFDIDGDGTLGEEETLSPAYHEARFAVPTFMVQREGGGHAPYRVILHARGREAPVWCAAGVWEGPIELGKKRYRLILFDQNLNGRFSDMGEDGYTFFSEEGPIRVLDEVIGFGSTRSVPTRKLHRLTQVEGVNLFNMEPLQIDKNDPATGCVVLTRDTTNSGFLQLSLKNPNVILASGEMNIWMKRRKDIRFVLAAAANKPHKMPALTYGVGLTKFSYKGETGETWATDCQGGTLEIAPEKKTTMELGAFNLQVRCKGIPVDTETPEIKLGAEVELTREITGARGEVYTRFRNETQEKWVGSTLRIHSASGKEVAIETLGYG